MESTQSVISVSPPAQSIRALQSFLSQRILGQHQLISRLLIALLADGHLLVEGAPGLAKTKAIKDLAQGLEGSFHRIQFTPDLLPGDLTGTDIYRPEEGTFKFQPGPLFHNLLLADEINRAPAKVQSALLEAMGERQITIGQNSYTLPDLFLVMATQNPIEQEGTYPLPEAQLDRFLMYVCIEYPCADTEKAILNLARKEARHEIETLNNPLVSLENIMAARQEVLNVHMSESLEQYIIQLILATREPQKHSEEHGQWIRFGASPRGTIALDRCARANAWLNNRDYVTPEDIQSLAKDVLRHRILLTFSAEAEGITTDIIIDQLLQLIPTP